MKITLKNFMEKCRTLYGKSTLNVIWICPVCKTEQSGKDFINKLNMKPEEVVDYMGFSCIGRWSKDMGCDYTLGGLFQLSKLKIIDDEGQSHLRFEVKGLEDEN